MYVRSLVQCGLSQPALSHCALYECSHVTQPGICIHVSLVLCSLLLVLCFGADRLGGCVFLCTCVCVRARSCARVCVYLRPCVQQMNFFEGARCSFVFLVL